MFIIGTLLGDGYLDKTTRGYSLRIHHGIAQKEYVDYKYQLIKCFVNSAPKTSGKAYYFRTVSHPELNSNKLGNALRQAASPLESPAQAEGLLFSVEAYTRTESN